MASENEKVVNPKVGNNKNANANSNGNANSNVNGNANSNGNNQTTTEVVGSRAWFANAVSGKKPNSGSIIAAVVSCEMVQEGDDFRNDRYRAKVAFLTNTKNAIGEVETNLRSGWLNVNRMLNVGETVNINLQEWVPVLSSYLHSEGRQAVTNVETGDTKFIASSINFVPTSTAIEDFKAGLLTRGNNGLFSRKFSLPDGWVMEERH